MGGTTIGGLITAKKIKATNPNHYKEIGKIGGQNGTGMKGFALNPKLASIAGKLGGTISRRRPKIGV